MKSIWKHVIYSVLGIVIAPAAYGADLKVPDCAGLLSWAKSYHPSKVTEIAPRVTLDNIFSSDVTRPLFGKPALEWNGGEQRAVGSALANCGRLYRKQRNRDAAQALKTARAELGRSLRGAIRHLARVERNLKSVRNGLLRIPATAANYRALAAYDTAAKIKQRNLNLAGVPDARIQAIAKDVVKYRAKIRGDALAKAEQAIRALPPDRRSLIAMNAQLGAVRADFDDAPEHGDLAALEALVKERGAAIRGKMTAGATGMPPMIFPQCDAFYKWAAATNMTQPVRVGTGMLYNTMFDDKLVPVFGRPLDAWTDEEMALFRDGMQACMQSASKRGHRQLPAGAQQAHLLANMLPSGRDALGRHKKSKAALADLRKKMEQTKPTMAGIQELESMRRDQALAGLDYQERRRFDQAVHGHQQRIALALMQDSIKGLDKFRRGYGDLQKIAAYRSRVMSQVGRLAGPAAMGRFETAFRKRDAQIAASALPEFKKKLAGLPIDAEALKVAQRAVDDVLAPRLRSYGASQGAGGYPSRRRSQATQRAAIRDYLVPFHKAGETRIKEIKVALHEAKCKQALSGVKLSSSQARLQVLGGLGPTTMGDVVCRLVMAGHKFHSLASPGFFGGKDHTMKVTLQGGVYQTIVLRMGEFAPGKKALIGLSIADANQTQKVTVQQWKGYAAMLTGQSMEAGMKALEGVFRNIDRQMRQNAPRR